MDTSAAQLSNGRARIWQPFGRVIDGQRGHLFAWLPVCFGFGIALYFALGAEPSSGLLWSLGVASSVLIALRWWFGPELSVPVLAALCVIAGFGLAFLRAQGVAAPVLDFRFYGAVEGRIVHIDQSQSEKPRLTLDRVVLDGVAAFETPKYVRVSLHGDQQYLSPEPGMVVMITAHLSPPAGPVEPGGYDFQRKAWFDQLGALGYTRVPALLLEPAEPGGVWLWVERIRRAVSAWLKQGVGGREGPFAAAIVTGDRTEIDASALEALRASNLAHLLAISGLHMGLLTGAIYGGGRALLAFVPRVALRVHPKRGAAFVALCVAFLYLGLSGASIATQRAFIMAAVMLVAICVGRRAISIRSVAIAALIVLLWRPEALMGPGFQMSFAATIALVSVFATLRDTDFNSKIPKWMRGAAMLLMSSAVAGLATAPFGAAHFNQMSHYGLVANLASVPIMGSVVMPGALLAAALVPIGLDWIGLAIMKAGLWWIIEVAQFVAGLDGAVSKIVAPATAVLPLIAFGGLILCLWRGVGRLVGLGVVVVAFALWSQSSRPALLVAESGLMLGLMTPDGRAINKPKGDGFTVSSWLENDGDTADQEVSHSRGDMDRKRIIVGRVLLDASTKLTADDIRADCARYDVFVAANVGARPPGGGCVFIGKWQLRDTGALAIDPVTSAITTSRALQGARFWVPKSRD